MPRKKNALLLRRFCVGAGVALLLAVVGWYPAGALGLCPDGAIAWVADWGWMSELEVNGTELRFNGKPANIETGELL